MEINSRRAKSILGLGNIAQVMDTGKLNNLVTFLRERVDDDLRSVIKYDFDSREYEVVYGREDVMEQYETETIDKLVQSYEIDSIGKSVEEERYEHGKLNCIVRCFERGIEINLLEDGAGVVIGLEAGTFLAHNTLVGKCMEIVAIGDN